MANDADPEKLRQFKVTAVSQTVFKPFKHFNKKEITVCHP